MSLPPPTGLPRPSIIVFDMDGTLIDVSRSYRETEPLAAATYLRLLGLIPPPLDGDVYDEFKLMGGFNDDWDLTAAHLELLLFGLPPALPFADPGETAWLDQESLLAALRAAAAPLAGVTPPTPDYARLGESVRSLGGGLPALRRLTGGRNAHLVWRRGTAATTDLVQCVFEQIYLGPGLFAATYGFPARYYVGPGLIRSEQLLVDLKTLAALHRFARLGIATGRARFEAEPVLGWLGLEPHFAPAAITTMSDALDAQAPGGPSLLKPHPYLLQRAASAIDPGGNLPAAYVGDTRDDVVAAQRARQVDSRPWLAIALTTTGDRDLAAAQFRSLGADAVLAHPDELRALWP